MKSTDRVILADELGSIDSSSDKRVFKGELTIDADYLKKLLSLSCAVNTRFDRSNIWERWEAVLTTLNKTEALKKPRIFNT
jgi:hypothetical protein